MTCQINLGAVITDVTSIKNNLFFPNNDKGGDLNWLQKCEISASPVGDILVMGYEKQLLVLAADWNSNTNLLNYRIVSCETLADELITAVLCLPVVTQNQSSHVDTEWTCIAVGFQSGRIRFYTEDSKLLLCEQFNTDNVCSIKCQSQHSPRPDINPDLRIEEVYIQYPSNVCVVSGNHLFGILRNHRSQLIGGNLDIGPNDSSLVVPKKWSFAEQYLVKDSVVVGFELSNTFDHLLTASTCGGFDTKYRLVAPNNTLVLGVGNKPFIGFHFAIEGGTQPMLTDVAKAIATKVKSALPNWLIGGRSNSEKLPSIASQLAEPMGCRFGICDLRRNGVEIILSPNRRLAAITDVLGRICLLNVHEGVVIRLFKGYREAQCAFLQVPDETKSRNKVKVRVATFLIIYCPKKGTLEILSAQQGIKIAVFTASKYSRLLYITHGIMGFSNISKSKYMCRFTCILIDPDGNIKEIVIPFHFALPEKNNRKARDMHLYKRLKQIIKSKSHNKEQLLSECLNTCKELSTITIQFKCLEMISTYKEADVKIVLQCSEYLLQNYKTSRYEELEIEQRNLKIFAENLRAISQFYEFIVKSGDVDKREENENGTVLEFQRDTIKKKKKITESSNLDLLIGAKEMDSLQKLLDLCPINVISKSQVSFSFDDKFTFSRFVSIFDLTNDNCISTKFEEEDKTCFLTAKSIFERFIEGSRDDFEDFKLNIINSNVIMKDMFRLLICYWVNRPLTANMNLKREMQIFHRIVYDLTNTANVADIVVDYNQTSTFWKEIRIILGNSEKPFPALTAALICRSVSLIIEHERDMHKSGSNLEDENAEIWEKLSQENCEWMLLIGKLEDISLLNIILSNRPVMQHRKFYILPKLKQKDIQVSLKMILEKGKGAISELVAQWLTATGIDPHVLNAIEADDASEDKYIGDNMIEPLLNNLDLLRKQFPFSTESGIILTNMCWEYAMAWQKTAQDFSILEASLKCLNLITNIHLRQGLYNLVWNTHLKIIFESACKLVNKVGKRPKEKLCRQDTGLTDTQMLKFIETCTNFLDDFLDVVQQCYNSERKPLQYEPIWDESNNEQPLGELALQQTHINYDLVHLHYQLSLIMLMQMTFNVKYSKIVNSLFDNVMAGLFFTDFQQKVQIGWHKSESKVLASRTQFLLKVISAGIDTLTTNNVGTVRSDDYAKWMGKILNLARVWNLDADVLKRFQVIQLYINGFDSMAEELLPAINELDKLGADLMGIGAKRLARYITSSKDLTDKMATVSPAIKQYLDTMSDDWCAPSSLDEITNIFIHSLQYMHEEQKEYKIGVQLFDACRSLQEISR
ncbi:rab3 GTPase-activating protein regulatory subunit [Agrilus planipennis]|uniref:Rab3 GTPase-activating protein regulatory subunit n=1 Tax=Agrilus planipennis TaxID=224129 RepID=A0A1W4XAX2_AGRPL|nr:rab3 GTPase-activating protein regulatory subunit [Agrilus planipennis]